MDRMCQQDAAKLGIQSPAPRRFIILGSAVPSRLDGRQIGDSGYSHIDEALGLLHRVAEAVLEDRHHASGSLRFGRDHAVDIRQRSGHGLLAENLLVCRQCSQGLRNMQRGRGADVDDVDVVHAQHVIKGPRAAPNGEFIGDWGKSPFVDIAQSHHPKLVRVPSVSLNMSTADAATDDGDSPYPTGCVRHWLLRASSYSRGAMPCRAGRHCPSSLLLEQQTQPSCSAP